MKIPHRPSFDQIVRHPMTAVAFANAEKDKARARKREALAFVAEWEERPLIVYLWKVLCWSVRVRAAHRRLLIQQIERGA